MRSRNANEYQKFSSDLIWIAVSQGLYFFLVGVITLPALTKFYSPELYGVWVQSRLAVTLLAPVLTLQLGNAVVRFLTGEQSKEKRRQAFGAILWPVILFSCFSIMVSILLSQQFSSLLFSTSKYGHFASLTFIWTSMEAFFFFFIAYLRSRGKIKTIATIQAIFSLINMSLIVALAIAGFSLGWVISCLIGVEALFNTILFAVIVRDMGLPKPNMSRLRNFLAFSVPLIPGGFFLWIIQASDRYFIAHFVNLSESGIYSASYTLGSLLILFFNPISFVLFPVLASFWAQGELSRVRTYLEYSTKIFLVLAIPSAAGLYVLSKPLLEILTTSEYLVSGSLILLIAVGVIMLGIYQINAYIILLVEKTKWLLLIISVAALINIGMNIALIQTLGIIGAAISTAVSYLIPAIIVTSWARKTVSYKFDFRFLSKVMVATIVMVAGIWFIPISNTFSIMVPVLTGTALFAIGLLVLRVFSERDWNLIRAAVTGINPLPLVTRFARNKVSRGKSST